MKPTAEQDILLRDYLRENLTYRETYEEVYDHIITALAHSQSTATLAEQVNQILREDFGGHVKLREMERTAKKQAISDAVRKYVRFYVGYFMLPALPFTLVLAVLVYFTLAQVALPPLALEAIFGFIIIIPGILSWRRYYVVGYIFRDRKKSIRDDIFARIAMVPTRLFVFFGIALIINIDKGKDVWHHTNPAMLTVLYIASAVYVLALIKLYRDEFKLSVVA